MNPQPGRIGKYRVDSLLGSGGMGKVFRGFDEAIERAVAIKAINLSGIPANELAGTLDRFRREAQAAGRLIHPNIVQVYEYGKTGDLAFIAMELVEGRSLHDDLVARRRHTLREVRNLMTQLLDALEHSHRQGVVHRDVKPANILLGEGDRVKLGDFGIARLESSNLTQSGQMFGTPYYMSPEQFLGQPVTAATDIYSAGVIAYELLTGVRPYTGGTPQIMRQVLDPELVPIRPSRLNANVAPSLDDAVMAALAKPREERHASAADFSAALVAGVVDSLALTGEDIGQSDLDAPPGSPASTVAAFTGLPAPAPTRAAPSVMPTVQSRDASSARPRARAPQVPGAGAPPRPAPPAAPAAAPRPSPAAPAAPVPAAPAPSPAAPAAGAGRRLAAMRRPGTNATPGSTFPPPGVSRAGTTIAPSAKRSRLLVVDDEARILNALKSVFRQDYHVFATSDCQHALAFMARYRMHVIISDQRMPGMTGVELLRKARVLSPGTMRILLTGYADLAAIAGSINDGEIYRFVSKPWDNNELRGIVREAASISTELAELGVQPHHVAEPQIAHSILVVDADSGLFRSTRELLTDVGPVRHAVSPEAAIGELEAGDVAVVLFDLDAGHAHDNANLIKILKQDYPQLLVIVVTEASDSDLMISLINEARIFRFINKPVALRTLRAHLIAALERAQAFSIEPQLVRVQAPEPTAAPRLALPEGWLGRLRNLGERIGLGRRR
jgi:serine/threonine protein kinase/response regulator RpfG family c-di-GMP phosphodiesterase